jgi:hypothetical protein
MSHTATPSETPNVVIESPGIRKGINIAVSTVAIVLGTTIVVDAASPAFDLSAITNPVSAAVLYLASVFNLAVTLPNVPRRT